MQYGLVQGTESVVSGSTTVWDTLGEGTTVGVFVLRSASSSQMLPMSKVLIPEPVPAPRPACGSGLSQRR